MSNEKIRNIGSLDKKTSISDRFQKMIEENSDLLKRLEPIDRAHKPVVFCYPTCTTCKKALKWLDERVFEYDLKNIKEEHPTQDVPGLKHRSIQALICSAACLKAYLPVWRRSAIHL